MKAFQRGALERVNDAFASSLLAASVTRREKQLTHPQAEKKWRASLLAV